MSLFGSKNKHDDEPANGHHRPDDDEGSSQQHQAPQRPPDELTRLLPNRLDSDRPFLTPDDPAVSPYNLWTVRVVRYATVLFTVATFVWWILQLVAIFVTPPGMHTRASGFFSFSYASLALFTTLFTLVFFSAPSRAVRVLSVYMGVMLLVNMIIMLAVSRNRHEEGWVGITSVIWALLMSLWAVLADRTVKWGKAEEEERLTGRVETRRTVLEWTAVTLSTISYVVLSVVISLLTLTLILRSLDQSVAPPGERYWVDGDQYQIHVFCSGNATDVTGKKQPTVLFEGGEMPVEYGLWQFADAAVANGSISRYCFVDRPGFAWSDTAPSPLSAGMAIDATSEALARADESGPWIVAAAGIGSIYARIFSSRHGRDIHGLLLIDPLHEDLLGRVASPGRGFLLWFRGIISPLGLERLPGAIFRGRTGEDRLWGRSSRQSGKTIFTRLQEGLVADTLTRRDVTSARAIQDQDTPLTVITSGLEMKRDSQWEKKQRDLTRLTRNLLHWDVVEKTPHEVWTTYEGRQRIEKRLAQLVRG
ncbi:mitochondrial integral membrane protein [Plectosphaerella plurivora]|uniref:Mitochondrial integral membrane protein n=1 Tax=Plectosphaerella plurivora TaxID=936078 RepID=A0A9P8V8X4_9PEZI|nr:mitochondrial integral membrane protein [Plectosphaerella plurivora]